MEAMEARSEKKKDHESGVPDVGIRRQWWLIVVRAKLGNGRELTPCRKVEFQTAHVGGRRVASWQDSREKEGSKGERRGWHVHAIQSEVRRWCATVPAYQFLFE